MAFSGPKGVELAGRYADELTIATGLDAEAIRMLSNRAGAARVAAGIKTPLRIWVNPLAYIVDSESEVEPMRKALRTLAYSGARFAFGPSLGNKEVSDHNIPDHMKAIMKERLDRHDYAYHGKVGDSPNAHLFDEPERFDISRKRAPHLAFGFGPHLCFGARIARLQGEIVLQELVRRFPNLHLSGEGVRWTENFALREMRALPVSW